MRQMKIGAAGITLIKSFESCKLLAYRDGGGVWTIGWGHTAGVKEWQTCTQAQADVWLEEDLADAEAAVNLYVNGWLMQDQFDALVSFVFNLGAMAFRKSTLLKFINSGNAAGVPTEWVKWKFDNGKEIAGLLRRRQAELVLYQGAR